MSIANPPQKDYGFVVGRFLTSIVDTLSDEDRKPDWRPIKGRMRFTPLQDVHVYPGGDSALVVRQSHTHDLDDQGRVVDVESRNYPEHKPGLLLAVGQYRVEPLFDGSSGVRRFTIEVTAEHTEENPLNLATQFPLETPPGFTEVVRIEDRVRAEDAAEAAESHTALALVYRDEAAQSAASAESHADRAEEARDETVNNAIEVDTSAGTRVSVGGVVVHYDSGERALMAGHPFYDAIANAEGVDLASIRITMWRTLNVVQVSIPYVKAVSGSVVVPVNWPSGFAPASSGQHIGYNSEVTASRVWVTTSSLTFQGPATANAFTVVLNFQTSQQHPNTLPGVPR